MRFVDLSRRQPVNPGCHPNTSGPWRTPHLLNPIWKIKRLRVYI